MATIFRLALRNLREHKAKTVIVSLFLVFGVAIVILGNSFLESVNRGLEKDLRANYTGDIVFSSVSKKGETIDIFGVNRTTVDGNLPQVPALPEIEKIIEMVSADADVKGFTRQISAQVIISNDVEVDMEAFSKRDDISFTDMPVGLLFAGDEKSYWETFSGINIREGRIPSDGSNEVLLDTRFSDNFKKIFEQELKLGDKILLMGANTKGIIREGTICGFFTTPDEHSAMTKIVYSSPQFARSFADLTYASSFKQELPAEVDLSLSSMDEDDLFGDMFQDDFDVSDSNSFQNDFNNILGDTSLRDQLNRTDDGSWNFVLLKLKNPRALKKTVANFQGQLKAAGIENVQVMDWKRAAISYTGMVAGIGFIFNLLIGILVVVVFIIVMNTMMVSVIERTGEIGTMRAIGAEKSFVRKLFYTEAISLTLISSFAGIVLAFVVVVVFNSFNISVSNEIAKMILGGGLVHFSPTFTIVFGTLVFATLASVVSNIYPVSSALKITPLKALSKGSE